MGAVGLAIVSSAMSFVMVAALLLDRVPPVYLERCERMLLWIAAMIAGGFLGFWVAMEYAEQIALHTAYESPVARSIFREIGAKTIPFPFVASAMWLPALVFYMARKARKRAQL